MDISEKEKQLIDELLYRIPFLGVDVYEALTNQCAALSQSNKEIQQLKERNESLDKEIAQLTVENQKLKTFNKAFEDAEARVAYLSLKLDASKSVNSKLRRQVWHLMRGSRYPGDSELTAKERIQCRCTVNPVADVKITEDDILVTFNRVTVKRAEWVYGLGYLSYALKNKGEVEKQLEEKLKKAEVDTRVAWYNILAATWTNSKERIEAYNIALSKENKARKALEDYKTAK